MYAISLKYPVLALGSNISEAGFKLFDPTDDVVMNTTFALKYALVEIPEGVEVKREGRCFWTSQINVTAIQEWYQFLSPEVVLEKLRNYPKLFVKIPEPTAEQQIAAVRADGSQIFHIRDPSEQLQMIAVRQLTSFIRLIAAPTESVQLFVVKKDPEYLEYIKHPFPGVVRYVQDADIVNMYNRTPAMKTKCVIC